MNKLGNGQNDQIPSVDPATPVVLLVGPGSRRLTTSEVLSYMSKRKLELT